jgi:hypothetical protein
MDRKEFVQMVVDEINTIKKRATKKEIAKLNSKIVDPLHSENCIYGQMTGHCDSKRAKELYKKTFENVQLRPSFNSKVPFNKQVFSAGEKFSALEKYLFMVDKKVHKHIVSYLKGTTRTLKIE